MSSLRQTIFADPPLEDSPEASSTGEPPTERPPIKDALVRDTPLENPRETGRTVFVYRPRSFSAPALKAQSPLNYCTSKDTPHE